VYPSDEYNKIFSGLVRDWRGVGGEYICVRGYWVRGEVKDRVRDEG
jgi:hypothetical protein